MVRGLMRGIPDQAGHNVICASRAGPGDRNEYLLKFSSTVDRAIAIVPLSFMQLLAGKSSERPLTRQPVNNYFPE